jgi:4-amino-4-deoxy-L-arabinose transferase-like glycosyltransferase
MLSTPPSSIDAGVAQTRSSALNSLPRAIPAIARDAWPGLALLSCVGVALFAIRLTGAPNLLDNEFRVGACALDVLQHGNWLCPHDVRGNTDKPPMLTWLTALASWPLGRVTRFTLYLPTAAATLLTAWIVAFAGGRRFGGRAGIFGGLAFLLSHVAATQMATARWDGLFALTVTVAALAAFRAWMLGGGWTLFWLAAAIATLTKGPLGVLLAGLGLGAVVWERLTGRRKPLEGSHATGIGLFLLITVGWFLLAYRQVGPHLVQNMFVDEFVGHMVQHRLAHRFVKPLGDFTWNFAPWSLFAIAGLVRVIVQPSPDDEVRRFERFLACWAALGVLLFCLSPHNQARLLAPMIPPAALLAGRELDRLGRALSTRGVAAVTAATIVVMFGFFVWEFHHRALRRPAVRQTIALEELARGVQAAAGASFPLTYVADSPFAMQLVLNTMRPPVSVDEAAALLRGDAAAFVVTARLPRLVRALGTGGPPVHLVARAADHGVPHLFVVSNRPVLATYPRIATRVGPLLVTLSSVHLGPTWDNVLDLGRGRDAGDAVIENVSTEPQDVRVRVDGGNGESRRLAPGDSWRIDVP